MGAFAAVAQGSHEEPALITLGFAYEKRPRVSGGAYFPVLRKVDGWNKKRVAAGIAERERPLAA